MLIPQTFTYTYPLFPHRGRGEWIEGFAETGKIMDGWESRRKREPGYDWCIIQLGMRGRIHIVDLDTNHFRGNYPEYASLEAICVEENRDYTLEELTAIPRDKWTEVVPASKMQGHTQNIFQVADELRNKVFTHVRLNMYPDGGIARIKVYGEAVVPPIAEGELIDAAFVKNGGMAIACNDEHFGTMHNLLMPNRGINMGDGWETRRRRGPGFDWCIVKLGVPVKVERIVIDTAHFRGNYPDECAVEGCYIDEKDKLLVNVMTSVGWRELLPKSKMQMHHEHVYESDSLRNNDQPVNYVRLIMYPDGGVSRFRVYGRYTPMCRQNDTLP